MRLRVGPALSAACQIYTFLLVIIIFFLLFTFVVALGIFTRLLCNYSLIQSITRTISYLGANSFLRQEQPSIRCLSLLSAPIEKCTRSLTQMNVCTHIQRNIFVCSQLRLCHNRRIIVKCNISKSNVEWGEQGAF